MFNLDFHQERFEYTQQKYFGKSTHIKLSESIRIPEFALTGLFRCRVTYSKNIENIEFIPHSYRNVTSLKLVEDNEIDYQFKYSDRKRLNQLFDMRGNCDDIIIIKKGYITDSFSANIVFFDGDKWITPNTPLLCGTQRAKLLFEKRIIENYITIADISGFEKAGLINAMQNLDNMQVINSYNIQE